MTPTSRRWWPTFGAWARPERLRPSYGPGPSLQLLDPHQVDLLPLLAHGQAQTVAGLEMGGIELIRGREDRHQLHGAHSERTDRFMANEDEVGGGPLDQVTAHFVGGRPKDRSPQADGEGDEKEDKNGGDEP